MIKKNGVRNSQVWCPKVAMLRLNCDVYLNKRKVGIHERAATQYEPRTRFFNTRTRGESNSGLQREWVPQGLQAIAYLQRAARRRTVFSAIYLCVGNQANDGRASKVQVQRGQKLEVLQDS